MKLHCLVTVRKPALLEAGLFVFRTIRTGFPTAEVSIWGNALTPEAEYIVRRNCELRKASFFNLPSVSHDVWIEHLVMNELQSFWICDTDIALWEPVEHWFKPGDNVVLAGRHEPSWFEPWTKCERQQRLHTALMHIDPVQVRIAMRAWMGKFPLPWGRTCSNVLVRQTRIPRPDQPDLFLDTMAGLYAAIGGTRFTDEQNHAWDHLNCGCYSDEIGQHPTYHNLPHLHAAAFADPRLIHGLSRSQQRFYEDHGTASEVANVIDPAA